MPGIRTAAAILALSLMLGGCATPYQPRGATGGYLDQKINDDTYLVGFYGNGHTPRDRVFKMWLYRCADLTSQQGYDYFVVIDKIPKASEDDRSWQVPVIAVAGADQAIPMRGGGGAPTYYYAPGGAYTVTTWSVRAAIRLHRGEPPKGQPRTFRAGEVLADLGPEVIDGQSAVSAGAKYNPDVVFGAGRSTMEAGAPPASGPVPTGMGMDDLKGLLPGEK